MHVFIVPWQHYFSIMSADPKEFVGKITDALKARRKELGLSHETVAEKAGIHRSTVSRVESKSINGTLFVFQAIASALDVPLSEICKQVEDKES
ncbi:MAG: helix-turn-helix transcriptional regulator [Verrucomicrobiota bacterium]